MKNSSFLLIWKNYDGFNVEKFKDESPRNKKFNHRLVELQKLEEKNEYGTSIISFVRINDLDKDNYYTITK